MTDSRTGEMCRCGDCRKCRHRAYMRDYYRRNKDRLREQKQKRRHQTDPGRLRERYGMTYDEYLTRVEQQGGVCAICRNPGRKRTPRGLPLVVDHDHRTGRIRGLLCSPCNTALGRLGDTEEAMERVLEYLRVAGL